MINKNIHELLNTMRATYGENYFNEAKTIRIAKMLEGATKDALIFIENEILDAHQRAPTPAQIRDLFIVWKKKNTKFCEEVYDIDPIRCIDCYESGFVFLKVTPKSRLTIAACYCDAGRITYQRQCADSHIPQYEKSFELMGMEKQKFPVDFFKPKITTDEKTNEKSYKSKLASWLQFRNEQKDYWQHIAPKEIKDYKP